MSFPYIQLPEKQPKFIERKMNIEWPRVSKVSTNADKASDGGAAPKVLPQEVKQTRDKQLNRTEQRQQRFFE